METLKSLASAVGSSASVDTTKLSQLQSEVHQAMVKSGFAAASCQTVCEVQVTIGPDGKPVPTVVCRLVCGF